VEGGKTGGLTGANLWLAHWIPMIIAGFPVLGTTQFPRLKTT